MSQSFYFQTVINDAYDKYLKETSGQTSLRKFAKIVGLNSGNLSQILRGQRGLRPANAIKVADNLKLDSSERARFLKSLSEYKGRGLREPCQETLFVVKAHSTLLPQVKSLMENFEKDLRVLTESQTETSDLVLMLELYKS